MTVVIMATLFDFANRVKLGVAVPPLTKEPITSPTPAKMLSSPEF